MPTHRLTSDLDTPSPFRGSILISGASSGIGLCCALMLSEQGFQVLAGYRSEDDAERLRALHRHILPIRLDVTSEISIQEALCQVELILAGRGLYGLVNNAGIAVGGPLEFLPIEAMRRQLEVNVIGPVALTQAFIPLLRQARGRIVNMGSIAGLSALPFVGPYSASKYALEALTDALRVELRPWGIEVAVIEPGVIATPIWEKSLQAAVALGPQLPPQLMALYGRALEILKVETQKASRRGLPPKQVAQAVIHALTSSRPRTRYLIGWDARLRCLFSCLPDRLQDWLIIQKVGFPG
jgi:NAD(P)-dependent dehydrogenase (short-subunit alcohol dehydrogenase family)